MQRWKRASRETLLTKLTNLKTMEMVGAINDELVAVIVDSGDNHNFISLATKIC